ncbi:MAG TPA: hypothetical protein VFB92_05155 [Vicinamibacterales bacterium]|nr:hypothetical protein [Vicinamibacterales bacterium]
MSLISWLVTTVSTAGRSDPEILLGMAGPLASAVGSWVAYERAHRSAPGRLTNVMITALAVKMVFFGGYVSVMLRGLDLRPVPFVVSFAAYFIALHTIEATFLRRLVMNDLRSPTSERA